MSGTKQNLDKAAREFEQWQWVKDQLHTPTSQPPPTRPLCSVCKCGMDAELHDPESHLYNHPFQLTLPAEYEQPASNSGGAICKSHGLAVLMTHVNDGEPCSDYLTPVEKEREL